MNEVYIKLSELGKWTESLFREKLGYDNKDIISVLDLIGTIEDLYCKIERLEEELKDEGQVEPDYYDEWHDRKMCEEE